MDRTIQEEERAVPAPPIVMPATERAGVAGVAAREALDMLRLQAASGIQHASDRLYSFEAAPSASRPMAQALDRTANYLHATPIEQMGEDLTEWLRHHPLESAAAAVLAGLALGAAIKRRGSTTELPR